MKIIIYITTFLLTLTAITYSQSVMEFEAGTSLTNDSGADISADVIIINGTYIGGGTINGGTAYILNLAVLIEGFYNPFTNIMVSDTVKIYLRNTAAPYTLVDSAKSVSDNSGIGTFVFNNSGNGTNYYLDIRHRNSIETWSAAGQSFTAFSMIYDFSNANTQAYGNNMTQVSSSPLRFAIFSGDVTQDGSVDGNDVGLTDNAAYNFETGYLNTDVDGNNAVDANDLAIVDNNAFNFVSKNTPP